MLVKQEGLTYKGTRILTGDDAKLKRTLIGECIRILEMVNYIEISIPVIQYRDTFSSKIGEENRNMMLEVRDKNPDRHLILAPEYTAVVQKLAKTTFKNVKNARIFYVGECFRGENTQYGRYRQFTQLGVEILNPTFDQTDLLVGLARSLVTPFYTPLSNEYAKTIYDSIVTKKNTPRGLDYYVDPNSKLPLGKGFEIHTTLLGTASQICGGGSYEGGAGFALGVDRLLLLKRMVDEGSFTTTERGVHQ